MSPDHPKRPVKVKGSGPFLITDENKLAVKAANLK
jgi:hypothetical protein